MLGPMLIWLWVSKKVSRPLPWDLPCRARRRLGPETQARQRGAGALTRLCSPERKQRVVWVPPAATGPKLHGPQVPAKHGAGQCPASGSGGRRRLPGQPSANASPALLWSALSLPPPPPSCPHCSPPTLSSTSPFSPPLLPLSAGAGAEDLGEAKARGPRPGQALPGALSSSTQTSYAAQERPATPPPPGDGNGLDTLTPAHEGGPLLVAAKATPSPLN